MSGEGTQLSFAHLNLQDADSTVVTHDRPTGKVTPKSLYRLLQWQEFRCALTGRILTPETAAVDHVVPLSKGGGHDMGNLQFLDCEVNRAKGTLGVEEFIELCKAVVTYERPEAL